MHIYIYMHAHMLCTVHQLKNICVYVCIYIYIIHIHPNLPHSPFRSGLAIPTEDRVAPCRLPSHVDVLLIHPKLNARLKSASFSWLGDSRMATILDNLLVLSTKLTKLLGGLGMKAQSKLSQEQ